jgi:putative endonuclease
MKQPAIYIMASGRTGTLYVGVTSDLVRRVWQHRNRTIEGFASKYGCTRLVHFEFFETMEHAIAREKAIKGGSRARKIAMIEAGNPVWRDLWWDIAG